MHYENGLRDMVCPSAIYSRRVIGSRNPKRTAFSARLRSLRDDLGVRRFSLQRATIHSNGNRCHINVNHPGLWEGSIVRYLAHGAPQDELAPTHAARVTCASNILLSLPSAIPHAAAQDTLGISGCDETCKDSSHTGAASVRTSVSVPQDWKAMSCINCNPNEHRTSSETSSFSSMTVDVPMAPLFWASAAPAGTQTIGSGAPISSGALGLRVSSPRAGFPGSNVCRRNTTAAPRTSLDLTVGFGAGTGAGTGIRVTKPCHFQHRVPSHRGYSWRDKVVVHALQGGAVLSAGGGGSGGSGKVRRVFMCSKCGARHGQYHGKCGKCGGFGTIDLNGIAEEVAPAASATGGGGGGGSAGRGGGGGGGAGVQALERVQQDAAAAVAAVPSRKPLSHSDMADDISGRAMGWVASGSSSGGGNLEDVPLSLRALSQSGAAGLLGVAGRIPLSGCTGAEVQRVLGGGVVPGALVLIGGDPGVGKSTITLQIAAMMAHPEIDYDAIAEQRQPDEKEQEEEEEEGVRHSRTEYGSMYNNGNGSVHMKASTSGGEDVDIVQDNLCYNSYNGASTGVGRGTVIMPQEHPHGDELSYKNLWGADLYDNGSGAVRDSAIATSAEAPSLPPPSRTVLYVTAEETREQVVARSRRMGLDFCDRVVVLCKSEMSAISRAVLQLQPDAVVMDSINTVYLSNLPQAPGTVTQIRECGQLLLRLAKDHRIAIFIIGHVTKGGEMAGPNMLAHMVDTVLYLEGDVAQSVRLLRVLKNRHGSDAECGVFTMDATGLHAVANHSALFLENRLAELQGGNAGEEEDGGASSVVGVTLQGSRAILVEVQALVSPLGDRAAAASSALSYRSATGVEKLRLANLCAILDKHVTTLELSSCSVIVNVVGGTQIRDVASDLALAVAIASSYYNVPVPRDLAVCGEVDLAGRVRRSFQRLDVRVREAAKLGFRKVIIPQSKGWEQLAQDTQLQAAGVQVVAVRSVAEALRVSLGPHVSDHRPPHITPPPHGKPPFGIGPPGSRFSRQNRTVAVEAAPSIATDGAWPHAAAVGGVVAAYVAGATVPVTPERQRHHHGRSTSSSSRLLADNDVDVDAIESNVLLDGSVPYGPSGKAWDMEEMREEGSYGNGLEVHRMRIAAPVYYGDASSSSSGGGSGALQERQLYGISGDERCWTDGSISNGEATWDPYGAACIPAADDPVANTRVAPYTSVSVRDTGESMHQEGFGATFENGVSDSSRIYVTTVDDRRRSGPSKGGGERQEPLSPGETRRGRRKSVRVLRAVQS